MYHHYSSPHSSQSAWSSSDDEGSTSYKSSLGVTEKHAQVITKGVVEFPDGSDQLLIEFPLPQKMKHSSSVYHLVVKREEVSLVNAELHVLNDCGRFSRVYKFN